MDIGPATPPAVGSGRSHRRFLSTSRVLLTAAAVVVLAACGGPPQAEISATVTGGQAPLSVSFTNGSKNADEFRWDFGDGATGLTSATEESTTHEYTKAGTHTVTLTAVKRGEPDQTSTATITLTVEPGPLDHVDLQPTAATLQVIEQQQFTATALDRFDNAISDAAVAFRSDENAGEVDARGAFTAGTVAGLYEKGLVAEVTQGSAAITVAAAVTVQPGRLSAVTIEPETATIEVTEKQQFAATAFDEFDNVIHDLEIGFESIGQAGEVGSDGAFTAGSKAGSYSGAVTAGATEGENTRTAKAHVTLEPGPLDRVTLDPAAATLRPTDAHLFSAVALDRFDNPIPGIAYSFGSESQAGSVDADGSFVAARSAGYHEEAVRVEVTQGSVTAEATADVTITPGPLHKVVVSPGAATLQVAGAKQFAARARDEFDNDIPDVTYRFRSDSQAGNVDGEGNFTAGTVAGVYDSGITVEVTEGSATESATARITLGPDPLDHITLEPAEASVVVAESVEFVAEAFDRFNNPLPGVTRTFLVDSAAGKIDAEGTFSAGTKSAIYERAVSVQVTGGSNTETATADVTVVHGPLHAITVSPEAATLDIGGSKRFTFEAFDRFGNPIPEARPTWKTSGGLGSVDFAGQLTAGTEAGTFEDGVRVAATVGSDSA